MGLCVLLLEGVSDGVFVAVILDVPETERVGEIEDVAEVLTVEEREDVGEREGLKLEDDDILSGIVLLTEGLTEAV